MDGFDTQSPVSDEPFESIAQRVIETVANTVDADPLELEPLYETIDPDALDGIFHSSDTVESGQRSRVVFTYSGCEVTVYADDEIEVTQQAADEPEVVIGSSPSTVRSN